MIDSWCVNERFDQIGITDKFDEYHCKNTSAFKRKLIKLRQPGCVDNTISLPCTDASIFEKQARFPIKPCIDNENV